MDRVTRVSMLLFFLVGWKSVGGVTGCGEVQTRGGAVRGHPAEDGDYCAFLGIPYAAPPTGNNRFKAPRPAEPWSGVLEANSSRRCVQPSGGEEDCLILNVFIPSSISQPLPVLVYFHGGGFLFNTAVTKGVGELLSHDIIVVSMNYRLGVLGFLCLGTEEAPGNAGLRDQLLALRWVQDNISAFGGDPTRVGALGTSVGATSIHLLAALPEAAGLFQSAVCLDGTAVSDYSLLLRPITSAKTFAKILGFQGDDMEKLVKFYEEVSIDKIIEQSMSYFTLPDGETGFAPCVENPQLRNQGVVVGAPTSTLYLNKRPMLFSYCDDEGSLRATDLIKNEVRYNTDFPAFMPANLNFPSDEVKYKLANKTKAFYFGNQNISEEMAVQFSRFWGDRQFVYPAIFSAREHVKKGSIAHLIEFTYVGNLSYTKDEPSAPGASHGDIINYLMPQSAVNDDGDLRVVKEITSMVANFVKTNSAQASTSWPAASACSDRLTSLQIGNETVAIDEPMPPRMVFWDDLYRQYRRIYQPVAISDQ